MNMKMSFEQMETLLAPTYKVGIYCRLSKDDDIKERESASIGHQREMMTEYCRKRGWKVEEIYVDDGYSGLNQRRPELQRLLNDVVKKKIYLVITKDYSRLGRNHLDTERLREDFFPRHDCRYIAINDNIDTLYEDEYAPFKSVINEQYSRDISKKVHSAYEVQAEKGMFTGCLAPFGYLKDPDQPGHLIIDEETADIVKQIFSWAEEGHGTAYIARRLEAAEIPCPTWWNRERGIRDHYTKWELRDPEKGRFVWDVTVLSDMLINPVYYGAIASQKKKYRFKLGVLGEKKPEDWIIVEGMHDPIISQDTFDVVQEKIKARQRPRGNGEYSLFAGLIRCGECGKALTIRKTNAKTPVDIYACVTYNKFGKHHCTQHRVDYDQLYDICLEEIRSLAQKAIDEEDTAAALADVCEKEQRERADAAAMQIERAKSRLETLDRMTAKLYDDLLSEKISESTFDTVLEKTRNEQEVLNQQIRELQETSDDDEKTVTDRKKWLDMIRQYADIQELDADMLNRLIRKIVVHETIDEEGERHISLEIHYNFRPMDETETHQLTHSAEDADREAV